MRQQGLFKEVLLTHSLHAISNYPLCVTIFINFWLIFYVSFHKNEFIYGYIHSIYILTYIFCICIYTYNIHMYVYKVYASICITLYIYSF